MVYKKRTPYAKKRAYRRKARVPPRKSAPSFDKRVKTVISRMAENKMQNFRGSIDVVHYTSSNFINSIVSCTPDLNFLTILQGTGQGDRIGNSVRVKSLKLSGVLRALPYNATTNLDPVPVYVKFLFLTRKDTPTDITASLADVIQYGNDSEGPGAASALVNLTRPLNKDSWNVHTTRMYKLGYSGYTGTSADVNAQYHNNNDFKLNHFINVDLTKYCTKIIKFDDNTYTPSSRNIILYPFLYTANGSVLTDNQKLATMSFSLDIVYEDM